MGILYVVATPIGNLEDITIRAIRILLTIPVIACEDTRRTGQLVKILKERYIQYLTPIPSPNLGEGNKRGVVTRFISVRDWNESSVVGRIITELAENDVALVSDAGTPLISDPGYKLVNEVRNCGYKIVPLPGASAITTALCAAGLPTNTFRFLGFLPKKWEIQPEETTIFYESPKRLNITLDKIKERYPHAKVVLGGEMTKIHEYFCSPEDYEKVNPNNLGEVTVLVYLTE